MKCHEPILTRWGGTGGIGYSAYTDGLVTDASINHKPLPLDVQTSLQASFQTEVCTETYIKKKP